jgi:NAD(P)-dependent dehydrogenase (short-subunit alcohol dehydrogenase family)
MRLHRAVALVTGANHGLGRALARALLERGEDLRDSFRSTNPGSTVEVGNAPQWS